ncbi:putative MFS family arabinose efflux permease [Streptomyces zagrosensis]|uniref:Putative MFS family arabinose efflux permease n=2 Tax=Streptomyces zagrosensis TaxID=1042984 RepID=A0A7W9QFR1_9ACTN|nr:putative MFS family arabinose efflux permease [Streptomyces zagrosensis]
MPRGEDAGLGGAPAPAATAAPEAAPGLGRGLLLLMSVAAGLSVAGNYFAQPLLDTIGDDIGLNSSLAALVVTVAQVGYGLGLVLLVPLGDLMERRRLAVGLTAATAAFLTVTASAPNGTLLLVGTALTGLTSVAAQVVVPYAATLAPPQERGRTVGTVMSGLVLGILLARTAAGLLADLGGWRTVYWVNAALMAILAVLLRSFLPPLHPTANLRYPTLLRSTVALLGQEAVLRRRAAVGALTFGSFSVLWTAMAFLLSGPDYGWSDSAIGLLGLAGAAGSLAAMVSGRLADRGLAHRVSRVGTLLLLVSWAPLVAAGPGGGWAVAALVLGVLILDLAVQAVHISNQNLVYAVRPEARNRLNSAYMTSYFVGGAVGSAVTSVVWAAGGWPASCAAGAALAAGALCLAAPPAPAAPTSPAAPASPATPAVPPAPSRGWRPGRRVPPP